MVFSKPFITALAGEGAFSLPSIQSQSLVTSSLSSLEKQKGLKWLLRIVKKRKRKVLSLLA